MAAKALFDLVHAPGRPGVDRWVDVAEGPLVGRQLAVRVHIPLAQEQDELLLGEIWVHQRERNRVEAQIPGGIPRELPLVRHGDHVAVVKVRPVVIAAAFALWRRRWLSRIAFEPNADITVIKLLRPEHPGEGLALDVAGVS